MSVNRRRCNEALNNKDYRERVNRLWQGEYREPLRRVFTTAEEALL